MVHVPSWQRHAARPVVLLAGTAAGVVTATALRLDRPGLGWLLSTLAIAAAMIVVARRQGHHLQWGWGVAAVALVAVGTIRAAEWLFALCLLAACGAGSLALTRSRTVRGLILGSIAVPFAAIYGIPWVARGFAGARNRVGGGQPRLLWSALVSLGLLIVFGALFAGADDSFASILFGSLPTVDGLSAFRWIFLFLVGSVATLGGCHLLAAPPALESTPVVRRTSLRRLEWVLPVGMLVALFGFFVAVQLVALFGGSSYVERTDGLTYAGYARGGFWQLATVTVLTLGVMAAVARLASRETAADRRWLRGLLGALACLTLVIVASALGRMWSYQQAYGFTVLRLLVEVCELWLGAVYLLVIAAGVRMRGQWLARAVVGTAVAALLALAVLNPDRLIAEQNILRSQHGHNLDAGYLSSLSADAVPALAQLPEPKRSCLLAEIVDAARGDDWRSWNLSRSTVADLVAQSHCQTNSR